TGSLHLGHARGAAVGDALCNVLDFAGYNVTREYYINDAGNQIVNLIKSIEARYRQELGQDVEMPEDGYHGEDIKGFAKELVSEQGDKLLGMPEEERTAFLRKFGLDKELAKIQRDLERFRVRFDVWFSETSLYQDGQVEASLAELRDKGQTYELDGATWLRTTEYGDDKDRVLVKNDGTYTYLTPDIAYHRNKYDRGFDRIINIWGADHHGYIPRVKAAMQAIGKDPEQLTVLIAQMVSLFQDGEKVKMSKRTGKAVTMVDLMDEVGVDPIRYFFTMRSMDSHLDFDMDLAIST
ncbi:arginine--tRNA ligase, partial [Salmonella enterica subsp. enterica]|nr:arginine--tRNA ligase [Salmonella enterica subsp. enterica]